ncbi:uncharacterized protein LOC104907373 [Beta vulgaris subsp. vulgaris]|uniref:uncharacterized protein LOC104907373 n=1 Tax=Beta vulgaris subsp. vulgaris TaxID=3555 RepID=UPI002036937D|nr:uncharacterized protein LOC104907373 [Beta vulgaris subsp. vulgaris]
MSSYNNINTNNSTCNLCSILSKDKLNVERFIASEREMIIVLRTDKFNDFHMQGEEATMKEMHERLTQTEQNIPNEPGKEYEDVLVVSKGKSLNRIGTAIKKDKRKQVAKYEASEKQKTRPKPKVVDEHYCYTCNKVGHWKSSRRKYLKDQNKGVSSSDMYVIEVNLATSASWVFDTACGSHIICNMQGLKRSRILGKGKLDLRVGNGARVLAILALWVYSLLLPSGLIGFRT